MEREGEKKKERGDGNENALRRATGRRHDSVAKQAIK